MKLEHLPEVVKTKRVVIQEEQFTLTVSKRELEMIAALMREVVGGDNFTNPMWHQINKLVPYEKSPFTVISSDTGLRANCRFQEKSVSMA